MAITDLTSVSAIVDVHTHMYPESYMRILAARDTIPLVRTFPQAPESRLILLPAELADLKKAENDATAKPPGRPMSSHFVSVEQKIHFMDTHGINMSVISLANPWLDFLDGPQAGQVARTVNDDFAQMCQSYPRRLFFFGALPFTAGLPAIKETIQHLKTLSYCRGVIMGTSGLGNGLDDAELLPVLEAIADAQLTVFLHPHYGLPNEVYGPRAAEYGHVLPLALGFPMETTIAVTRMFLAGVFDKTPGLRLLLAHSGGTLPFLAGRIESCILHDAELVRQGKVKQDRRTLWDVLKQQVYLDAVIYSSIGLRAAVDTSGSENLLFGTDHPFFPPVTTDVQAKWESVGSNARAVLEAAGNNTAAARAIMGENAIRILALQE